MMWESCIYWTFSLFLSQLHKPLIWLLWPNSCSELCLIVNTQLCPLSRQDLSTRHSPRCAASEPAQNWGETGVIESPLTSPSKTGGSYAVSPAGCKPCWPGFADWVWLVHRVSLEAVMGGGADGVCWLTLSRLMCLLKAGVKCVPWCYSWWDM